MNNHTQIDVDMARSPANGERRPRRLRAVGNFVAEEPTPLPDSQERECKRLRILFLHNEHRFREEILRLAVEERECKRLRILLQRTEHRFREYILFSGGDPGDFICSRDFVPDIIHVPVDHEAVTKAAPKATEAAPKAAKAATAVKSTQALLDE